MNVKFDHLVHFTNNPEKAQTLFKDFGFTTIKGGSHRNWGTHNSLCYFHNLGYIEWIGFTDFEIAKASDNVLIQQIVNDSEFGEGFSQIAFRTYNMTALNTALIEKGFETIGPFDGNRKKEDGTILTWSMLFIKETADNPVRYPFFIQWGQPDDVRKYEMKEIMQHQNCVPSLSYIGFIVQNVQAAIAQYSQLFDLDSRAVVENEDEFGSYTEIALNNVLLRFYHPNEENKKYQQHNRPFLSGILGIHDENVKTITIHGGTYQFFK